MDAVPLANGVKRACQGGAGMTVPWAAWFLSARARASDAGRCGTYPATDGGDAIAVAAAVTVEDDIDA